MNSHKHLANKLYSRYKLTIQSKNRHTSQTKHARKGYNLIRCNNCAITETKNHKKEGNDITNQGMEGWRSYLVWAAGIRRRRGKSLAWAWLASSGLTAGMVARRVAGTLGALVLLNLDCSLNTGGEDIYLWVCVLEIRNWTCTLAFSPDMNCFPGFFCSNGAQCRHTVRTCPSTGLEKGCGLPDRYHARVWLPWSTKKKILALTFGVVPVRQCCIYGQLERTLSLTIVGIETSYRPTPRKIEKEVLPWMHLEAPSL